METYATRRRPPGIKRPSLSPLQSQIRPPPWSPIQQAISTGTILRWIALGALLFGLVAMATTFGLLQARDNGRQHDLEHETGALSIVLAELGLLIGNITGAPNCTLDGNVTISSNFSDADFAVFFAPDPTADLQFNLTGLDTSSLVTLSIQDDSGVMAYLGDIQPIGSVFQDDEFTVQNAVDPTKMIMFDCATIAAATTRVITIQDASGIAAYLSDIPVQPSTFLDDVFAVQNTGDPSREIMFDASIISTGTTRILTVQDADGIIALLSDLGGGSPPFSDAVFGVFDSGDFTASVRLDCSGISPATTQTMTVPDGDGTIAYLSDATQVFEVLVNTTRRFPDLANEGVTNLTGLGDVAWIEISFCGGGGGGGQGASGGGGGGGAGFENFRIEDPIGKLNQLNCTVGLGGAGSAGGGAGGTGTDSELLAVGVTDFFLSLVGLGGLGGVDAGSGGDGGAGDLSQGGLAGGLGNSGATDGDFGPMNLPWRSGGGGSQTGSGSDWQGGPAAQGNGAASMFSGDDGIPGGGAAAGFCAGGAGGVGAGVDGADGGDGAFLIRYFIGF